MPQRPSDADVIREMINAENTVINHRTMWMATFHGFLFAALGFAWTKPVPRSLVFVFASLGVSVSLVTLSATIGATKAMFHLIDWWEKHTPDGYDGPPIIGLRIPAEKRRWRTGWWNWHPALFAIAWLFIAIIGYWR